MLWTLAACVIFLISLFKLVQIVCKRVRYIPLTATCVDSTFYRHELEGNVLEFFFISSKWSVCYDGCEWEITEPWPGLGPVGGIFLLPGKKKDLYFNPENPAKSLTPSWKWHVFLFGALFVLSAGYLQVTLL